AIAISDDRLMRRTSFDSKCWRSSKPDSRAPMRVSTRANSGSGIAITPDLPAKRPSQNVSTEQPNGLASPIPVTTTRSMQASPKQANGPADQSRWSLLHKETWGQLPVISCQLQLVKLWSRLL